MKPPDSGFLFARTYFIYFFWLLFFVCGGFCLGEGEVGQSHCIVDGSSGVGRELACLFLSRQERKGTDLCY